MRTEFRMFCRRLSCYYSIMWIGWAILKSLLCQVRTSMTWIECFIPCLAESIRSSLRIERKILSLQMIVLSSTPSSLILWIVFRFQIFLCRTLFLSLNSLAVFPLPPEFCLFLHWGKIWIFQNCSPDSFPTNGWYEDGNW